MIYRKSIKLGVFSKLCFFFEELRPLGGCHDDQTKVLEQNSLFAAFLGFSICTSDDTAFVLDNMLPLDGG